MKHLTAIQAMVTHSSVAGSEPEEELDAHEDTCVVGDNCLVIHDHNRLVNICNYDSKDGHRSTKTVHATVGYCDLHSGQKYFLMINQSFQINGLKNNLQCPMQCHLNVFHISEVPMFLAESPSVTTHSIYLLVSFKSIHTLIILVPLF